MALIAKKLGMTRHFCKEKNVFYPVTFLHVDSHIINIIKKDQGEFMQVSYGKTKNKPLKREEGLFSKSNISPTLYTKELPRVEGKQINDPINVDIFNVGEYVDVTGYSIGKGFAGPMKRHNFGGLRATHGVSISHRSHGSTGHRQRPSKVFKGKKMAGHMGNNKVTIQSLKIMMIFKEDNIISVHGGVPGHKGSFLKISKAIKK